jgi:hypothetical protein
MMNYLDAIGESIRQNVDPSKLPQEDTKSLFRLYAVLLLAKGASVTLEDVHNAWSAWMSESDPDHDSIRPFHELRRDTQELDRPYVEAIQSATKARSVLS